MVWICTLFETVPSLRTNLDLSTALIWSNKISPFLPWKVHGILVGKPNPLVVIGATMTVFKGDISSGETTTHGLVFLISTPFTGSNWTSQISNLLMFCFTIPNPYHQPMGHPTIQGLFRPILGNEGRFRIVVSNLGAVF
jgi:hypothetical protein